MNSLSSNADVWVIDQRQVLLMKHRDLEWFEEQRIPFDEFMGSAIALSSFSLPDTQLYLNITPGEKVDPHFNGERWACVDVDPVRITQVPVDRMHQQMLAALKTMGAKVQIISTAKPTNFHKAPPLVLLNKQEFKHLENLVNAKKTGEPIFPCTLRFFGMLWLKPGDQYQRMRGISVLCVLLTFMVMNWLTAQHQTQFELDTLQRFQNVLKPTNTQATPVPFADWAQQIRKFGQAERANITSIKMSWNEQAGITTKVDLERDRKRVPKACRLINSKHAECSTGGLNP